MLSYNMPKSEMKKAVIEAHRKDHLDGRYEWLIIFPNGGEAEIKADEIDINHRGDLLFFDYYEKELVPVAGYAEGTWKDFFLKITVEEEVKE